MRKFIAILFFLSPLAVACNTIEGAGKDVQKVGEKIEEKADDAK